MKKAAYLGTLTAQDLRKAQSLTLCGKSYYRPAGQQTMTRRTIDSWARCKRCGVWQPVLMLVGTYEQGFRLVCTETEGCRP